jgi:ABC-type multidrug transport system fused ATPase/permease subunit
MFNIMFFTVGGDHAMSIRAVSFGNEGDKKEFDLETMTEAEINAAKLNIMIEDGGTNLSVGQRQLICIARAFISKPKILLMDEATANIDEKTDQAVQALIKSEFSDTTVITITHRLNTIIQYDKILV